MIKRKEPVRVGEGMLSRGNHSCLPHAGLERKVILRKSAQEKYQGPVPLMDEGLSGSTMEIFY